MTAEFAAARVMSTGAAGSSRPAAPLAATARTTRWGVAHVPDPDDHRAFHVIDGKGGDDTLRGSAAFGAIEVVSSISGSGIDKYDEATRQRHIFGQHVGPDGDACWPEKRQFGGTVFCDLESIRGLHWDTGDVRVADSDTGLRRISGSNRIFVGSGYMCLLDEGGAPWCWEWSPDVQPRPARAPQDAVLYRIVGAEGFACGQTPDYVTVTCWTVGVDQQSYQQANHRFRDDPIWLPHPSGAACMVRWAIPHGAGLLAAIVAGVASFRGHIAGEFLGVSAGAGLVAWLLVYASSLWDSNGRGWHDKAAGTVVINDPVRQPSQTDESRL